MSGVTVVYIDRVFLLNTLMDYLLLLTTARLSGLPLRRWWLLLWAALGGVYASAVFLPEMHWLGHPLGRLAAGVVMALAAFRGGGRQTALFFLLAAGLAGVVLALGLAFGSPEGLAQRVYYADISWPVLVLTALAAYGLLHILFGQAARHGGGELLRITIAINGRHQTVTALHDTGNTLRDPVSGRAALVLERRAAEDLWPQEVAEVLSQPLPPEEKMARLHRQGWGLRFTLLPFRAVGTEGGLLLAARSDYIEVDGKRYPRTPVALSEQPVSDGGGYHALWGAEAGRRAHHVERTAEAAAGLAAGETQAG